MVVFTCNHCGEALHKPKVEKHITFQCKKRYLQPSVSCIDCMVDFPGQTYADHKKCVTELERYSKPGTVVNVSNKGERKQASWTEIVTQLLDKEDLPNHHRQVLESLVKYSNIPRKKAKFMNFISNSCKHLRIQAKTAETVFELIENEFKIRNSQDNAEKNDTAKENLKKNGGEVGDLNNTNECENGKEESAMDATDSKVLSQDSALKKKKGSKKLKKNGGEVDDLNDTNECENGKEKSAMEATDSKVLSQDSALKQKKGSKKLKKNGWEVDDLNDTNECENAKEGLPKKATDSEVLSQDSALRKEKGSKKRHISAEENGLPASKKVKKDVVDRVMVKAAEQAIKVKTDTVGDVDQESELPLTSSELESKTKLSKKEKKKLKKAAQSAASERVQKTKGGLPTSQELQIKNGSHVVPDAHPKDLFDWDAAFAEEVQKALNNEIAVQKLRKKVIGKYKAYLATNGISNSKEENCIQELFMSKLKNSQLIKVVAKLR